MPENRNSPERRTHVALSVEQIMRSLTATESSHGTASYAVGRPPRHEVRLERPTSLEPDPQTVVFIQERAPDERLRIHGLHSTSLEREVIDQPALGPQAAEMLGDLVAWTDLTSEQLGHAVGASRRSVYNWLRREPISEQALERITETWAAIAPIAPRRSPRALRGWLLAGDITPLDLLHHGDHHEFALAADEWLEGRIAERVDTPIPADPTPEEFGPDAHRIMLEILAAPAGGLRPRRPEWQPRELTGAEPIDEDTLEP